MTYVALFAALCLSSVAAYFSVLGLAAIFAASAVSVMVMAGVLEATKVITAAWLHLHWHDLSRTIKTYLTIAVVLLMGITSMGIFGYLSKAHIEQQVKIDTTVGQKMALLDLQIDDKKKEVSDYDAQVSALDASNQKTVGLSTKSSDARKAMDKVGDTAKSRKVLIDERKLVQTELAQLQADRVKAQGEADIMNAEVGPIKYIADRIYGKADRDQLEKAVFWLIMILVICFDPLAIALVIGTNIRFKQPEVGHLMPAYASLMDIPALPELPPPLPQPIPEVQVEPVKEGPQPPPKRQRRVQKIVWAKDDEAIVKKTAKVLQIPAKYIEPSRPGRPKKGFIRVPDHAIMKIKD
jgi:hypothetical protein